MMIWDFQQQAQQAPPTPARTLFLAAGRGDAGRVRGLLCGQELPRGAPLEQVNGQNCFHAACKKGHVDVVELLLAHSAQHSLGLETTPTADGRSGLLLAAYEGRLEVVQLLCRWSTANPATATEGAVPLWQHVDQNGNSAVHYASWGGHLSVLSFLLETFPGDAVIATDKRNDEGMTPIQFASAGNFVDIVSFLSSSSSGSASGSGGGEGGADSSSNDDDDGGDNSDRSDAGNTPFHKACQYGALDTV